MKTKYVTLYKTDIVSESKKVFKNIQGKYKEKWKDSAWLASTVGRI